MVVSDRTRALARWNWQRLGDASALSQRVPLIYLPFGLIGPVLLDPTRVGGSVPDWFMAALMGQGALMATFFLASVALKHVTRPGLRPLFVLLSIAVAACLRAITLVLVPAALGITDARELGYRIGAALTTQTGMLIIFSLLVSAYDYHRRLATELREQEQSLDLTNRTMQGRIEEMRDLTLTQVHQLVTPLMTELDSAAVRAVEQGNQESVNRLIRQIVDDELRPLSHALVTGDFDVSIPDLVPARSNYTIPLPSSLMLRQVLMPLTLGLLTVLLALSPTIRELNGFAALVFPVASGLLVALIIFLINGVVGKLRVRLWLAVVLAGVIVGGSFLFAWFVQSWLGLPLPPRLATVVVVTGFLVGILLALYVAVTERRIATEESLRESVESRLHAASLLRQRAFVMRRQLGHAIHGPLQSACHAAAMRLAAEPHPSQQLLIDVRDDLARAVAQVSEQTAPYVMLIDTLSDIASLWEGTCRVEWVLDHRTVRAIAENPTVAVSVGEIVRECVTNAVKHGGATQVKIAIERSSEGVAVTATDNGRQRAHEDRRGLGSRLLDELSMDWERRFLEEGTVVTANLATVGR